jgi:hypothetical protein
MFQPTKANVSCSSLSASVTCEHANAALSYICLQSIGGSKKLGEPGRSNPGAPVPTAPEDLGTGVASPRVALPGAPMLVLHITQSRSKPPASPPSQVLVPSTSTLTGPSDVPSAPGASRTNGDDSSSTGVPCGTDATKDKYRGVIRCVTGHRMVKANEVGLLSPQHHLLKSEQEQEKWERGQPTDNVIPRGHWQEGPRASFHGRGLHIPSTRRGRPRHYGRGNSSGRREWRDLQYPK